MKLMFIGDSIACSETVSPHLGWVTRIGAALPSKWVVYNMSFTGDTTRLALEKMPRTIQKHHPEIVVVQLGMNDCNYWQTDGGVPRVSRAAYRANLEEIAARIFVYGGRVYYMTSHPTPLTEKFPYGAVPYEESRRSYCEVVREICPAERLIDIERALEAIGASDHYTQPDGVHLNELGNDLYYDIVFPVLWKCVSSY